MVGGTKSKPPNKVAEGHAETVLGGLELKNPDGSVHERLIKIRNPWAETSYDGPYSKKSKLWTPEFKKQADFEGMNDGIFYTPIDDFMKEFDDFTVGHVRNWEIDSI